MIFRLSLLMLLLVFSAFFSGAETALFALTRHELSRFRKSRRPSERAVAALMEHPRHLLLTLMIGNVTVNMFIFAVSLSLFSRLAGPSSLAAPLLGLVSPLLVTLFGEILPKGTAIELRRTIAPYAARPVQVFLSLLAPVVRILNVILVAPLTRLLVGHQRPSELVTVEELRELLAMSQRKLIIDADENAMLSGAVELNELKVRDIVVPRVDVIAYDVNDTRATLARLFRESKLPKLPVYREDLDHLLGLVYARDFFLGPGRPIVKLVRPVPFVPEIITLSQLLQHFRQSGTALAMAVDEYGGVVGLVTIEDVAEQLVGELSLPDDETTVPETQRLDDRHYRISGHISARDWAELFHIGRLDERVTTLAGLVVAELGRLPVVGDQVTLSNVRLTVESLKGKRIEWMLLELLDAANTTSAADGHAAGRGWSS